MERFFAKLSGRNEVPEPVRTRAFGVAKFITNRKGTKIKFLLEVENIENFVQAHIHLGRPDENGPVLAFLFGADVATLTGQNGITTRRGIVKGVIKDEDVIGDEVGVECVEELLELMREGKTYVNVHTEQNPAGEIRGQIMPIYLDRY